jgi:hypothetical protein
MLGLAGGIAGVVLAYFAVAGLVALAPRDLTRSVQITFDMRIVLFAFFLSVLTSIIFGLAPSLVASHGDLNRGLHEESRTSTGSGNRMRRWLVALEIACSVALMAGAGLLFRSVVGLQNVDPGLDAHNVLTFRVSLPNQRYKQDQNKIDFFKQAAEQLRQLPGVRSASAISYLPFNGLAAGTDFKIAGRPPAKPGEALGAVIRTVLPDYFHTMGIPLIRGRDFTTADDVESTPHRFIVNEAFVRKHMPTEEPLGKQISVWMNKENPFGEIVGVVGDVKERTLDKEPEPTIYYIHSHLSYGEMVFVLRARIANTLHGNSCAADVCQPAIQRGVAGRVFTCLVVAGRDWCLRRAGLFGYATHAGNRRPDRTGSGAVDDYPHGSGQRSADGHDWSGCRTCGGSGAFRPDEKPVVWDWPARSVDVCRGASDFCGGGAGGSLCARAASGEGVTDGGLEGGIVLFLVPSAAREPYGECLSKAVKTELFEGRKPLFRSEKAQSN